MNIYRRITGFFILWLSKIKEQRDRGMSDFEKMRHHLKPCDVLLMEGRSRADRVVQSVTLTPWSHGAIYIGRPLDIEDNDLKTIVGHFYNGPPESPLLVESLLGEGIAITPLNFYEQEHLRICRPKSLRDKDAEQVIRFAINRLGAYSGGEYFFDLLRFFLPWHWLPVRWRRPLFRRWAGRHTKNVSADFIADCFGFIQFPIYPLVKTSNDQGVRLLRRPPQLCMPHEIDLSPNFDVIKYPFIDFKLYDKERLIPWKGSGIYSGVDNEPALTYAPKPDQTNITNFPKTPEQGDNQ